MLLIPCFGFLEPAFHIQASLTLRRERDMSNMNEFTLDSHLRNIFGVSTGAASYDRIVKGFSGVRRN